MLAAAAATVGAVLVAVRATLNKQPLMNDSASCPNQCATSHGCKEKAGRD